MIATIAGATARSLLARRRAVLMVLLAALPVLFGLVAQIGGALEQPAVMVAALIDRAVVGMLLPLLALVFGTAALGAELDDGTAIHLLTKPVARWRIVAAKVVAAAPIAAVLAGLSTLLAGLAIGGAAGIGETAAYTVGVVVGAVLYTAVFVALSVLTSRALIVGLVYVVVWEGMLAGLFEGTRVLSIRQYVGSIAAAVDPSGTVAAAALAPPAVLVATLAVFLGALLVAVRGLERYQISTGD